MSALEHLTFDTTGLVQHRDDPNERIWLASDDDVILLQHFGGAPPLRFTSLSRSGVELFSPPDPC